MDFAKVTALSVPSSVHGRSRDRVHRDSSMSCLHLLSFCCTMCLHRPSIPHPCYVSRLSVAFLQSVNWMSGKANSSLKLSQYFFVRVALFQFPPLVQFAKHHLLWDAFFTHADDRSSVQQSAFTLTVVSVLRHPASSESAERDNRWPMPVSSGHQGNAVGGGDAACRETTLPS